MLVPPTRDDLPESLPLFPLDGALLLPAGDLPLNIFEPRYIAMIEAALASDRFIGMIQRCPIADKMPEACRPFYAVGCAGRISSFEETEDGRFLINLHGVSRFHVKDYAVTPSGYYRAHVDFSSFKDDIDCEDALPDELARPCLVEKLKAYLEREELFVDWTLAQQIPDNRFYTLLAMVCPFSPAEKQALLEAKSFAERCQMLKALLELSGAGNCAEHNKDLPC